MVWSLQYNVYGLVAALLAMTAPASDLAPATVVIYNSADPSSEALARYYAQKRRIDSEQVVGLRCSQTEEISRSEFQNEIARPLREIFRRKGWWRLRDGRIVESRVRFLALIRGMPFKINLEEGGIAPRAGQVEPVASRDEASVDSELATLARDDAAGSGLVPNPYYDSYVPVRELKTEPGLLLVCRLDAPSESTVRAMIDDAIAAETNGLWGWAYVDSRDVRNGPYSQGDMWLTKVARDMRREGIPVLWEKSPQVLPQGFPVTEAAVYYGWYAESICGPFAEKAFRFKNGAIAVHVHSFSASRLRDPLAGWCGPLLERGAAVTLGTVDEPYLSLTAHLDIFQSRLMKGFTFAESAYMSLPALSWMNVALGDPLYRPYAAWHGRGRWKDDAAGWRRYRAIILAAGGDVPRAAEQLQRAADQESSSFFLESLAAAQVDAGEGEAALRTLGLALAMETEPLVCRRLGLAKAGLIASANKSNVAETGGSPNTKRSVSPRPRKFEAMSAPQMAQPLQQE